MIVSEPSDRYTVETNATWGFQPNSRGLPTLSTLIPGELVPCRPSSSPHLV